MFDLSVPRMETKRLILREIRESDFVDMFEYAKLPNVGPVAGWAPHKRLGETKAIIKGIKQIYTLCEKHGVKLIVITSPTYKTYNNKIPKQYLNE